jgi:hypothetical protein
MLEEEMMFPFLVHEIKNGYYLVVRDKEVGSDQGDLGKDLHLIADQVVEEVAPLAVAEVCLLSNVYTYSLLVFKVDVDKLMAWVAFLILGFEFLKVNGLVCNVYVIECLYT